MYDIDIVFLSPLFPSLCLSGLKVFTRLTYSILIIILITPIVIIILGILSFALVEIGGRLGVSFVGGWVLMGMIAHR